MLKALTNKCNCVLCDCDLKTFWDVCELCAYGRHNEKKSERRLRLERLSN